MKVEKHPQTELEYWEVIEGLGGFIWRMNHDLADGRIEDPTGSISKEISEARTISDLLVKELGEKFEIIHPNDCPKTKIGQKPPPAPEGKTYYWDWYEKTKTKAYNAEYEKIICSACPFSEGVEQMINLGGNIPCGIFTGIIHQLSAPHMCAMVDYDSWSKDKLHQEILNQHGDEALKKFKNKEAELEKPNLINKKANTPEWLKTEQGQKLFEEMFKAADLPEVEESDLEPGTYTNQQIAEKFGDPKDLILLLMKLPQGVGNASKRSTLSFAVDQYFSNKI